MEESVSLNIERNFVFRNAGGVVNTRSCDVRWLKPHIDVSLTSEHDPKLQEYCVCPQNMPQFDFEGIPNQAPETNKPMILNGPTSRNREGSDQATSTTTVIVYGLMVTMVAVSSEVREFIKPSRKQWNLKGDNVFNMVLSEEKLNCVFRDVNLHQAQKNCNGLGIFIEWGMNAIQRKSYTYTTIGRKRRISKSKQRWIDAVEEDAKKILGVRNCRFGEASIRRPKLDIEL
ncbi:hypothetical protein ANN_18996 [Periplaneta americana]|uniref:Uncharacterized protein n=1 Tax=Periplaneta americana TaxID=6978 RepID=A0ABQ8SQ96_PERAM|nr:hypothetical protein ANN_18996 [Periplaneta americana]